jgi:hypothetical protein
LIVIGQCGFAVAFVGVGIAAIIESLCVLWVDLDCRREIRNGPVVILLLVGDQAAIVEGQRELR